MAIESLAEPPDPSVTAPGLVRSLAPGGIVAVVDDMPTPAASLSSALARFDVATFKTG